MGARESRAIERAVQSWGAVDQENQKKTKQRTKRRFQLKKKSRSTTTQPAKGSLVVARLHFSCWKMPGGSIAWKNTLHSRIHRVQSLLLPCFRSAMMSSHRLRAFTWCSASCS